jgi:2-polyprenyl-6-methoxyphenol hydroxylase-like FAD-dependent oxidoreductase
MAMQEKVQVVIVGGGPVGVALAVELGQRGISCAVVERYPVPQRIPKGQNLTQRTLEHFYFWGCVDELRAARIMPPGVPTSGVSAYGSLMGEYWDAPAQRELVRDYYFQDYERLPQYETEYVLRRRMAALPSVKTWFGWGAESVEQDEKCARVAIAERGGNGRMLLEADYVVGCDGGHSIVRSQAGIARSGADFDQKMMLAVFRSRELHEGLARFPVKSTYTVLHPDLKGYWQFFGRIDVGESWFFHAPVPLDTTAENFDFLGLLHQAAGFKFACEFEHIGFWDLRVAVAEQYQVGRIFIAGDAAHSHPPYGGFGLNNGLEDATNLGWKLAARLDGWGSDALLASYGEERRPIFKETAEDFIAARIEQDRVFLENFSPERDRVAFERAWAERMAKTSARAQVYEPHYEGSSVVAGPPGAVCSAHGQHTFSVRTGHHLPPQLLSSGRNVFEELGSGFTLLAFGAEDEAVRGFEAAACALGVPLKLVRDSHAGGRLKYECRLILVRPDQYVVWSGDTAPADPAALMARVSGRG